MSDQERLRAIAEREQNSGKGPWSHDGRGTFIFGSDEGQMIAEVRGWGYLTGTGGLGLDEDEAVDRQKAIGEFIAQAKQDVPYLLSLVARQAQEIQDLRTTLDKERRALEEREASCCPEDVSFEENIAALRSSRDALREALVKLRDCDWVISLSDRMDAVRDIARKALAETPTEDR